MSGGAHLTLDSDLLVDIRNTTAMPYVRKNGRLYERDTLSEVYPPARLFEWAAAWRRNRIQQPASGAVARPAFPDTWLG